ncbi:histidinol-phosphatase HisJ family protein [Anaerocolumna aminovalerica]|uniref:histidinol-phosphatase HisJ family protein n=1 Tax=Anaerocolumna aminovalerica TaxID=1527 RepID=UPI00248D3482|nr:histidinol-phosphatase HisJ family protein [Anaerocolumna aminovalerica]
MIKADYHLHSSFSSDSETPMESQIEKAIELGLEDICFTEHMDLDYPKEYGEFNFSVEEYFKKIKEMQEKYRGKISIYKGVEFGLIPEIGDQYETLAGQYEFDFIIGSTHLYNNLDPYYSTYWEGKTPQQGTMMYFEKILDNIQNYNNYDTLGHIDYIIRYQDIKENPDRNKMLLFDNYSYSEYGDVLDEILKHIIYKGKALEVNAAGYRYGLGAPNPQYSTLVRYKELGGELITIGSDAHKSEHLGCSYDKVEALLKEVGFRYYATFHGRNRIMNSF